MSRIGEIRLLVRAGLYYLTQHAYDEAADEELDVYDIENGLTGMVRRTWPREGKYEVIGQSLDNRSVGVICRITAGGKVRVITVYEDRPRGQRKE